MTTPPRASWPRLPGSPISRSPRAAPIAARSAPSLASAAATGAGSWIRSSRRPSIGRARAGEGVREVVVIAQDTARYGVDRYRKRMLATLLERLSEIDALRWIRVMYG